MADLTQAVGDIAEQAPLQTTGDFTDGISLAIQLGSYILYTFDPTFILEFELVTVSVDQTYVSLYFKVRPTRPKRSMTVEVVPVLQESAEAPPVNLIRVKDQ